MGSRYKDFLGARLTRIYPIHFLTILLLLPFFGQGERFSAVALVHNLLLTQGPWNGTGLSWNAAAWSLSVEWHAYLIFPLSHYVEYPARGWLRALRHRDIAIPPEAVAPAE